MTPGVLLSCVEAQRLDFNVRNQVNIINIIICCETSGKETGLMSQCSIRAMYSSPNYFIADPSHGDDFCQLSPMIRHGVRINRTFFVVRMNE